MLMSASSFFCFLSAPTARWKLDNSRIQFEQRVGVETPRSLLLSEDVVMMLPALCEPAMDLEGGEDRGPSSPPLLSPNSLGLGRLKLARLPSGEPLLQGLKGGETFTGESEGTINAFSGTVSVF